MNKILCSHIALFCRSFNHDYTSLHDFKFRLVVGGFVVE